MVASPCLPTSDVGYNPLTFHYSPPPPDFRTRTVLHIWILKIESDEWCALLNLSNDVTILKGMNVGKHPQCSTSITATLYARLYVLTSVNMKIPIF
jgi:hypothetical protein